VNLSGQINVLIYLAEQPFILFDILDIDLSILLKSFPP